MEYYFVSNKYSTLFNMFFYDSKKNVFYCKDPAAMQGIIHSCADKRVIDTKIIPAKKIEKARSYSATDDDLIMIHLNN